MVRTLCSAIAASPRADCSFQPATMFTMNRATRMTRIDPKPMYNFLPIVISKTLHPYGSALCRNFVFFPDELVAGTRKIKLHNLRGFFGGRQELPFFHRILTGLNQQRMSPDCSRALHMSIGRDNDFDFHLA